ncbi:MAG TPA: YihY/virulence factor BrkB family protein [Chthoniobacterales bacterium]|jgi:Ca2+-transporting ATPase|nr:YihY/virulence factor BrkB family protein [Chthoniobacterales bacterium]
MSETRPLWEIFIEICKKGFARFANKCGQVFKKYGEINGDECAASFAYYAFFSLFPLILLLVAVGTLFVPDRYQAARHVVRVVEQYIPLEPKDRLFLFTMVDDAIQNGWRAGIFGLLVLLWSALRFFQALVIGINRAWGGKSYNWWKLPLKNLLMIGILASALLFGLAAPLIINQLKTFHYLDINAAVDLLSNLLPIGILFYGLTMLYKFAPRRPVRFKRVWLAALLGTVFLRFGTNLFNQYLATFTNFDALYGAFAAIMGLLLWIYYTGVVLLLGGCMSATTDPPDESQGKIQTEYKNSDSAGGLSPKPTKTLQKAN